MKGDKRGKGKSPKPPGMRRVKQNLTEHGRAERSLARQNQLLNAISRAQASLIASTDNQTTFDGLLSDLLSLTESEYGFIGEVFFTAEGQLYLKTHAITNISWNEATRTFYEQNAPKGMEFYNLKTLFGAALTTGEPVIANDPSRDPRRGGLPDGHPPLNAFLGIPIRVGDKLVAMTGIANRPGGYSQALIDFLQPLLATIGQLVEAWHNDTERKQAEEALRESEDRYRDLVEHSHDLLCTHDLEGKLLSVNPAVVRIGGYSKDELLGMNFGDFLAPEVRGQFGNYLTEIQAKGAASGVMLVQTKGGEKRLWEYDNTLRTEGIAAPIVRGMARDITEQKRAEEALRRSEERFRQLYDNAPIGYFEYDTQGRITNVNRTELEMLGYTLDEMIGQSVWKFIVEEETTRQQILAKLAGTMPPARGLERNYKKKDGTVLPVSIEDRILRDPQGRITGIRCTIQDITDRKKAEEAIRISEEKYRTILETIEEGYYEVDITGNFTLFNDSLCRMLGYTKDELMGMNNRQYMDKETAKKVYQVFNQLYTTGEPYKTFDWEIIRKDGTKRFHDSSVSLIRKVLS